MKRLFAFVLAICMLTTAFAGCGQQANTPTEPKADQASTNEVEKKDEKPAKDVDLTFFTGKVETVDLLDEIIADFNAQSGGITVEQEYQNDASNIIKIKFASGEAPDIMTTYEQEYVDQGKYLDLSDMDEIWNRLIPSMKESCTDISSGKQYRICTNMTMAGFFYNKEIFAELGIEPATTWEGFVANLEKIKTEMPDVDPWFIFGSEAWHLGHLIEFIPHGYIKAKYGATAAKTAMPKVWVLPPLSRMLMQSGRLTPLLKALTVLLAPQRTLASPTRNLPASPVMMLAEWFRTCSPASILLRSLQKHMKLHGTQDFNFDTLT